MNKQLSPDSIDGAFGITSRKRDFLEGLNPNQRIAVETIEGPLRILAGAGTGKTTVLSKRIAHMISIGKARPNEILAVTFTKKAAGEMKNRLSEILGPDIGRSINVGNFHSICSEILRRNSMLVDLPSTFNVLDEDGQRDVIAAIAIAKGFLANKKDRNTISNFLSQIASWKEEGHSVAEVLNAPDLAAISLDGISDDPKFLVKASQIYRLYQDELKNRRWCDFADLILHTVMIFRKYPDIRAREASRYRFVLVDEYQDTSPVQSEWVRLMAQDHGNICVVGDTDQSIYEWRNARPEIMMNFHNDWPGCKQVTIDQNYRSSQQILDVANTVVAPLRQKDGLDKLLKSPKTGAHPRDFFASYRSGTEEATSIARQIQDLVAAGTTPAEIAVLCRSGMIITGIERALRDQQIKYVVAGAMKFTDREEVKDAIAYLQLASNPMDYVAFERIVGKPTRGIGPTKVAELRQIMMQKRASVREAVVELSGRTQKKSVAGRALEDFARFLTDMDGVLASSASAGQVLEGLLESSGYLDWRRANERDAQRDQRLDNIDQIISEACAYDRAVDFLESMALQSGGDTRWTRDSVVISTVHASKGLEFDVVFTPAMEDGIFPNARSEKTTYGPDEERRLAHVAWTRARKDLRISWAEFRMNRTGQGHPSHYLFEADMPVREPGSYTAPSERNFRSAPTRTTPTRIRPRVF